MDCEKALKLFRSPLVVINVGPKLFATALEKQGYPAIQMDWQSVAGGDRKMQEILALLGGLD